MKTGIALIADPRLVLMFIRIIDCRKSVFGCRIIKLLLLESKTRNH
jgi:hypothetical protein